jgi:Cdc6-like AAA superfamily ATPase
VLQHEPAGIALTAAQVDRNGLTHSTRTVAGSGTPVPAPARADYLRQKTTSTNMAYRQLRELEDRIKDSATPKPFPEPEQPIGRTRELEAIRRVLSLVTSQPDPVHLWVWGPQGTGKTHCTTYAASEIAKSHRILLAYSNCWSSNSLYALVNDVIDQFGVLRAELQDTRFKLERIKKHVGDRQCIFIIDEVDRLEAKERNAVLYQFHDLKNFWIVAISHQEPQKQGIEPRVWSRLSPVTVAFSPYTDEELRELLKHELKKSTYDVKPTASQLRVIAEQSDSDARRAKKLLVQKVVLGLADVGPSSVRQKQRDRYETAKGE